MRYAPFTALGLYGVLRWATMLRHQPLGRLLALLVLAVGVSALGSEPLRRRRAVALGLSALAVIALIPISGLPLSWVLHLRLAVTVRALGDGLSGLSSVLVPYNGADQSLRAVIVMGAGVLLLDAALLLAFSPRSLGRLRTAVAALPLVVLATVPSALSRPPAAYLHGLLMFALLAMFVWSRRARSAGQRSAVGVLVLCAAAGAILAPSLDSHKPWVNFERLAGSLGPSRGETFDWAQRYGPLVWPQTGRQVFEVQARRGQYWKTENLDAFDGRGWTVAPAQLSPTAQDASAVTERRFTERLHVTIDGIATRQVIVAGTASRPTDLPHRALPGAGAGMYAVTPPLGPRDSYLVDVYAPDPSAGQMRAAGSNYPHQIVQDDLTMTLEPFVARGGGLSQTVPALPIAFASFHAPNPVAPVYNLNAPRAREAVRLSPYGRAFDLAQRLSAGAPTPYAFVQAVQRHLQKGFKYNESPAPSRFPIEDFLFRSRLGYCQQFAGAMALLLRMGGVPARVATGFTTGARSRARNTWLVADQDAHTWVEAFFPGYGWVKFDPTPGTTATGNTLGVGGSVPRLPRALPSASGARQVPTPLGSVSTAPRRTAHDGSGLPVTALIGLVLGLAAVLAGLALRRGRGDPLTELERAFALTGRPLAAQVTLATLEQRFRRSPEAGGYIRSIRLARYGGEGPAPTQAQRRALREQLALGAGPVDRLRALWALPPLWLVPWARRQRRGN